MTGKELYDEFQNAFGRMSQLNDNEEKQYDEICDSLSLMTFDVLKIYLPKILFWLLSNRDTDVLESVIIYLDGALLKKQIDGSWYSNIIAHKTLLHIKQSVFFQFTVMQANCICDWLEMITPYVSIHIENDFFSARYFWMNLAGKGNALNLVRTEDPLGYVLRRKVSVN